VKAYVQRIGKKPTSVKKKKNLFSTEKIGNDKTLLKEA